MSGLLLGPSISRPLVYRVPVLPYAPRQGSRAVLAAYRTNAWLRAVVDTVAEATATPRWRVLKPTTTQGKALAHVCKSLGINERTKDGRLERHKALARGVERGDLVELRSHELLSILENPHPQFTGRALRKLQQVHLDLAGESFLWLRRTPDALRRVAGFEVVPPPCVTLTPTETENGCYFIHYNLFTGAVPESDVVWLRHLDPENPHGRGVGKGLALGNELDTAEAIQGARMATFARGGLPAAVVGIDEGTNGDDRAEELQAEYEEKFNSPESAGRVWFISGKATLAQIQQDFRALQMDETEKGLRDYARQTYNVSPELMGDLTSANRSTSEEAKYTLAEYAVLPRLEFKRTEYQLHLATRVDRDAILDYDDPRPHSWERRHQAMTAAYHESVYMNEAREHMGLPPDPALDGVRCKPIPGAQPVQDARPSEPRNPPPPRGPAAA
jgi:phage portal protein BeeE